MQLNTFHLLPLPADILVYINDFCVLGFSHKEIVELLKAIPVGHTVDVVVRRGYPMLYNSDGCPKMPNPRLTASLHQSLHLPPPTTTQPQAQPPLPYAQLHLNHSGPMWSDFERGSSRNLRVRGTRFSLDANGNSSPFASPSRQPSSYQYSNGFLRPPRSARSIRRLQSAELASLSDSEVVSAIGSHRWEHLYIWLSLLLLGLRVTLKMSLQFTQNTCCKM